MKWFYCTIAKKGSGDPYLLRFFSTARGFRPLEGLTAVPYLANSFVNQKLPAEQLKDSPLKPRSISE